MIYYKYTYTFNDDDSKKVVMSITQKCEDVDYPTSLEDTKLIVKQQMYLIYSKTFVGTEDIATLTLAQYNAIVKGVDVLEPIPDLEIPPNEI
jgi:phage tail tube protein FII